MNGDKTHSTTINQLLNQILTMPAININAVLKGDYTRLSNFHNAYKDLQHGEERQWLVKIRGYVTKKLDESSKFKMYTIVDRKTHDHEVRIVSIDKNYSPTDDMTFEEMHEDVQNGDLVDVYGYPRRSLKGNLCMYTTNIVVKEYGNNDTYEDDGFVEFVDEENFLDAHPEDVFVPSEDSDSEESESEESDSEVKKESEVTRHVELDPRDPVFRQKSKLVIPDIPLTIYENYVKFYDKMYLIKRIFLNPLSVEIKTDVGNFKFCYLSKGYCGVDVSPNPIEMDEHPNGYDMILKMKFSRVVRALHN